MPWLRVLPQMSPWLGGQEPHLTQCVIDPYSNNCQMTFQSAARFKREDTNITDGQTSETTNRQTDHIAENV